MERTKQKSKKEKPNIYVEKDKSSSFISDVKAFKENLKISEILKTVKMNSSMRIKAPRGSKVMQNKDFNDNEDIFDDVIVTGVQNVEEPPCATNTVLNNEIKSDIVNKESSEREEIVTALRENQTDNATNVIHKSKSLSEGIDDCNKDDGTPITPEFQPSPAESAGAKSRDRKLSLDHTMLLRREGLSQSEVDLNSIGKSPLERKSSFFKKKMDSFVRNTTEIFKRQSMTSKSTRSPIISRRDSTSSRMSVSLQSLNEDSAFFEEFKNVPLKTFRDQQSSVASLATPRTDSTLSINTNDRLILQAEVDTMAGSPVPEVQQPIHTPSTSTHSLNKEVVQVSLLNSRAISMSSGLDTATGHRRRKISRSNRVSWLASESLTDYFRRLIQDEKSEEVQGWQSSQDFSTIPEYRVNSKIDSKGRRLSYMRAVSGEDSSLASSFRRKKLMESEGTSEIERVLAQYSANGVPMLDSFEVYELQEEAKHFLEIAESEESFRSYFPKRAYTSSNEELRQAILQELIITEAQYIQHLKVIVDVYIAAAHALQNAGLLLDINSCTLFPHLPDVVNSSLKFWERVIYPMLHEAKKNDTLFDPKLIVPGFLDFPVLFEHYEGYVQCQSSAVEYLRNMQTDPEFVYYLNWCNQQTKNRLQLADILIKPMQRLTKYNLIIARLTGHVDDPVTIKQLKLVEQVLKSFVTGVNRRVRQIEEFVKIDELRIDPYEPDYKGEDDMEYAFKHLAYVNLHQPMLNCGTVGRCLIHQGVLRYKDFLKEFDAHILLFTDMMLICKKLPKIKDKDKEKEKEKKEYICWKMLRPKIMINRLVPYYQKSKELSALVYVVLDEMGCAQATFQLTEASKDSSLKTWELNIFEAMVSYTLTRWYYKYPSKDLFKVERAINIEEGGQRENIYAAVEKRARERVAAMLHPEKTIKGQEKDLQDFKFQLRMMTEYNRNYPQKYQEITPSYCSRLYGIAYTTINQDKQTAPSFGVSDVSFQPPTTARRRSSMAAAIASGLKGPDGDASSREDRGIYLNSLFDMGPLNYNAWQLRSMSQSMALSSAGSSNFRSSSEFHFSMSGGSHEELGIDVIQRPSSAMERNKPPYLMEEAGYRSPAIKVHMAPENDTETLVPSVRSVKTPTLVLQESSPNHSPETRSASAGAGSSENTLRVASSSHSLVHSMPDINSEVQRVALEPRPIPLTASERLYRSHQELMHKNRLAAGHYLKPDHRGSSYPPPSPRALQRGDALSFSFRYPPLTRTKNVPERASTSQLDSPRRIFGRRSPQSDMATGTKSPRRQRSPSPIPRPVQPPGKTPEKKKSLFLRRSKECSPEFDEYDADADISRRSGQEKIKHRIEGEIEEDAGNTAADNKEGDESQNSPKKDNNKG